MSPRSRCGSRTDEPDTARGRSQWRHRSHPVQPRVPLDHHSPSTPWCRLTSQLQLFNQAPSHRLLQGHRHSSSMLPAAPSLPLDLPPCLQQLPTFLPATTPFPDLLLLLWIWWQQLPRYMPTRALKRIMMKINDQATERYSKQLILQTVTQYSPRLLPFFFWVWHISLGLYFMNLTCLQTLLLRVI